MTKATTRTHSSPNGFEIEVVAYPGPLRVRVKYRWSKGAQWESIGPVRVPDDVPLDEWITKAITAAEVAVQDFLIGKPTVHTVLTGSLYDSVVDSLMAGRMTCEGDIV
jgi:hypothetical protein